MQRGPVWEERACPQTAACPALSLALLVVLGCAAGGLGFS